MADGVEDRDVTVKTESDFQPLTEPTGDHTRKQERIKRTEQTRRPEND
jgi:hypothetical protein